MNITQFEVGGLFGKQQVTIPISGNKLVIVGVNGIGKSTILSLFYYLLSRRWTKIVDIIFDWISIDIDGQHLTLTKAEIQTSQVSRNAMSVFFRRYLPQTYRTISFEQLNHLFSEAKTNTDFMALANTLRLPVSERILNLTDTQTLRSVLARLHENPESSSIRDRYIAHLFSKLGGVPGALAIFSRQCAANLILRKGCFILAAMRELKKHPVCRIVRGKYLLWYFLRLVENLKRELIERHASGERRHFLNATVDQNSVFQLLAGKLNRPTSLKKFFERVAELRAAA